ncbi:MAG: alkaline phosphatase family protein [Planctomycetota bacterium]|nr:MAG: alkaline phosphatase family protein [Planctomycetota bacterium]REK24424.1 MAG: alkaline phosphatase family protein [Planctomycetota bacterium]REK38613.1 MAG: alkaline phosphatase family protein [Planctomycetota bacterium]
MHAHVVLLSIPGLRAGDLSLMPRLSALNAGSGNVVPLTPSFPCVTCPVQANLTTGVTPEQHGVIANGFFWRDKGEVEMWTAWNDVIQAPQIWDVLHQHDENLTSAVWFPLLCKDAGADFICTPAPIHNPDGTESLWCYTRPQELYQELLDKLGHFPLMNFWGPLASMKSADWIVDSACIAAAKFHPKFSYIYLHHIDNVAQKFGPDSPQVQSSYADMDAAIGKLIDGYSAAGLDDVLWLVASEYVLTEVDSVSYPNRLLRDAGFLTLGDDGEGRELLNVARSQAWALVDHQFAHVFVRDAANVDRVAAVLREDPQVERLLIGDQRADVGMNHERSGEIVLISKPNAWFAYYWWLDDTKAPSFARTVDIHQKPGYDPVELFIDMPTRQTPLDPTLVKASHGYPADDPSRKGIFLTSDASALTADEISDIDVPSVIYRNFGLPTTP